MRRLKLSHYPPSSRLICLPSQCSTAYQSTAPLSLCLTAVLPVCPTVDHSSGHHPSTPLSSLSAVQLAECTPALALATAILSTCACLIAPPASLSHCLIVLPIFQSRCRTVLVPCYPKALHCPLLVRLFFSLSHLFTVPLPHCLAI